MRTIKIDITTLLSEDDKASIQCTIADCTKVFALFALLGNRHKSTSYQRMHKYGYDVAVDTVPNLPTAIVQQTAKNALASVKSWNSNIHHINQRRDNYNAKAEKYGKKAKPMVHKWEYRGERHAMSYPINMLSLSRRGSLTTFSSNSHRIRILHDIPQWFVERYPKAMLQAGSVVFANNKFFINLVYRVEFESTTTGDNTVGLDRGINTVIASSRDVHEDGKHILKVKSRYLYNRKQLQQKGTRSAKRRLKKQSGREKRFMLDVNHCISKRLANDDSVIVYVLEDLTGIRKNESGNKERNRLLSNWSFCQLEFMIEYKCFVNGISVEYVDPRYTSQKCSACKRTDKASRNKAVYTCIHCGYTEHADTNAANNIRDNYLLGRLQPSNRISSR